MTPRPTNARDERGLAMLYAAVFLLASLWLASLAIDMGKLMATKTELQRAADAAALAGASAIDAETGLLKQDLARDRAYETASKNEALQDKATPVWIDRDADVGFPKDNRVQVRVHRSAEAGNPVTTIFARTLGLTSLDVHAVATAEVSPINPCDGVPPFAVVDLAGGYTKGGGAEYHFNMDVHDGTGPPQTVEVDAYMLDYGTDCNEGPCKDSPDPLSCYIRYGYGCCIKKGDSFDTIPIDRGKISTVRNALGNRWGQDTDQRDGITYAEYRGDGSRVLICPIVTIESGKDNSEVCTAKIVGFSGFFLTRRPALTETNLFTGEFIDYLGSGDPASTAMSNKLFGTRLVE